MKLLKCMVHAISAAALAAGAAYANEPAYYTSADGQIVAVSDEDAWVATPQELAIQQEVATPPQVWIAEPVIIVSADPASFRTNDPVHFGTNDPSASYGQGWVVEQAD
jgi:hypothetical protein